MSHRVAPRDEADLDDIWLYVAKESGSIDIANRVIDAITDRFFTLARSPILGVRARRTLAPGTAVWPWERHVIMYCVENDAALILRVVHGRRQLETLFGR